MSVRFVLVRPRNPLNVGAAARALKNFGFDDLCAVDPYAPVWKEAKAAVGAEDVLANAKAGTLDEMLADRQVVLGTHDGRRRGGPEVVDLPDVKAWLAGRLPKGGSLAVLIGPEKTGLANAELSRCHAAVRIPTSRACPSMNASQAAAVVAYELARPAPKASRAPDIAAMTHEQREAFVAQAAAVARATGWRPNDPEEVVAQKFRDLLLRRPLARDEAACVQAIMRRLVMRAAI